MSNHRAIIVDDEESARNILSSLLKKFCPQIEVVAMCEDVEEAVIKIKKQQPSLVFLDIEMPNYSGYEIVNFFDQIDFEIVFITAYDNYAIKAFEIAALDYLLKPIDIDRLKEAVSKFIDREASKDVAQNYQVLKESLETSSVKKVIVPYNGGQRVVETKDIVAISAAESYSYIHTTDQRYLLSKNLKQFENLLSENKTFFRTHKSWIINLTHLRDYSRSDLQIQLAGEVTAKLSKYKKVEFETVLLGV